MRENYYNVGGQRILYIKRFAVERPKILTQAPTVLVRDSKLLHYPMQANSFTGVLESSSNWFESNFLDILSLCVTFNN